MKILTIVGARPQFIKAAPVSLALQAAGCEEFLLHTGQHYDDNMSQVFFDELGLPQPDAHLGVGSGSHAWQTGHMLIGIESVLQREKPDCVLVYGDTNSTLAGALTAAKLHLPLAHVEAGLRSFNRKMPEEINRILTDHCADYLFCPTATAQENLHHEGLSGGVYLTGDVMYDALLRFQELAAGRVETLSKLGLQNKAYTLVTIHRAYNTDDPHRLAELLTGLAEIEGPLIFPLHPRTRQKISQLSEGVSAVLAQAKSIRFIPPASYLEMLVLEKHARLILTDSGGVQKEAYLFGVPCLTLRPETEWIETVQHGWNRLVLVENRQSLAHQIAAAASTEWPTSPPPPVFGDGHAAEKIVACLLQVGGEHV